MIDLSRTAIAAVLCTLGITAHAQSFHGGIAGGSTKSNSACVGATTCDKTDIGGRAWVGVTNANGLGVEIVAHDFGAVHTTTAPSIAGKATLRGIGIGPMWDFRQGNWSFHARAGFGRYHTKVRASDSISSIAVSDNSTEFYWSAGFGYRVSPRITLILAADSTEADNRAAGYKYDAMLYSFGVQVGF